MAIVSMACLGGYMVYLVAALALVRAPLRIYVTLGIAPVYIAWKVGLYVRSLVSARSTAWVRTARVSSSRLRT